MQDFQLARQRMADMHFDAAVVGGQRRCCRVRVHEVEDGVLDASQQVLAAGRQEQAVFLDDLALASENSRSMCAWVCFPQAASSALPTS
jgi:hypothetical protein